MPRVLAATFFANFFRPSRNQSNGVTESCFRVLAELRFGYSEFGTDVVIEVVFEFGHYQAKAD